MIIDMKAGYLSIKPIDNDYQKGVDINIETGVM